MAIIRAARDIALTIAAIAATVYFIVGSLPA